MASLPKPKPGILDITPYVAGKSKVAGASRRVIKLSSNENPLGPSPLAVKAYTDAAAEMHRYPDTGCVAIREAIGKAHGIDPARIVCGNGSDELIGLIAHAYAGKGDEVLMSQYAFAMYRIYTQGTGATPVTAREKDLTAGVDTLKKVTPRTRILFLANPNNPTGTYLPATEVKRLRNKLRGDILLVIDSAYAEYAERHDYSSGQELVEAGTNTVMLRTFSKIYALAALRLGWGYFPTAIADVMGRVRGPFNVATPAQAAGIAALADSGHVAKAKAHNSTWLSWVASALSKMGITVYPSLGNFVLAEFEKTGKTAAKANAFLTQRGIIVREMGGYGLPQCLRITIGTEEENRALTDALGEFMQQR